MDENKMIKNSSDVARLLDKIKQDKNCNYSNILKNIDLNSENIKLMKQYNLFSNSKFFDAFNDIINTKFLNSTSEERSKFVIVNKIVPSFWRSEDIAKISLSDADKMKFVKDAIFYDKRFIPITYHTLEFNDDNLNYKDAIVELFNYGFWTNLYYDCKKELSLLSEKEQKAILYYGKLLDEEKGGSFDYRRLILENIDSLNANEIENIYNYTIGEGSDYDKLNFIKKYKLYDANKDYSKNEPFEDDYKTSYFKRIISSLKFDNEMMPYKKIAEILYKNECWDALTRGIASSFLNKKEKEAILYYEKLNSVLRTGLVSETKNAYIKFILENIDSLNTNEIENIYNYTVGVGSDYDKLNFIKKYKLYNREQGYQCYYFYEIIRSLKFDSNSIPYKEIVEFLYKNKCWDELTRGIASSFLNKKEQKVIKNYSSLDKKNKSLFKKIIVERDENLSEEQIDMMVTLINRISHSNSSEIEHIKENLISQLIDNYDPKNNSKYDPIEEFDKIEDIYLRNNLPTVGKNYLVFKKLHPTFNDFYMDSNKMSPALKQYGNKRRDAMIFSDMLKVSLGSNNRDLKEYLYNLERGNYLFTNILNGNINYNALNQEDKTILSVLTKHITTLYNNTLKGKKESANTPETSDIECLAKLAELFKGNVNYSAGLKDRIVSMFGHFAGFDKLEDMKNYMNEKVSNADKKNRESVNGKFTLDKGDFSKEIDSILHLGNILQNGSVARDFLGDSAASDRTPLDTDLSRIEKVYDSIGETIGHTISSGSGSIWFALKDDGRFLITRDFNGTEKKVEKSDLDKIEAFRTCRSDHWGIRTGFASSEIDYIISKNPDKRIGLEVAMNGFYIPVVDLKGNLIFSPKDYDELREKMSGLKHYGENEYKFSDELESKDVLEIASNVEENMIETKIKRNCINKAIQNGLNAYNPKLTLRTINDGDLSKGSVDLIDTGSTGRGTNKPGDGDFDFMMKLDNDIFSNEDELNKFKEALLNSLGASGGSGVISSGDFRLKDVNIEGLEKPVDIDITFAKKTNKIKYSTDESLKDRLSTIRSQSPEKYDLVVANIILAKKVLKEAEVYKPNHGAIPQGGLGGVGVENWILQNGGSFYAAAYDFIKNAEGKSFEEFKNSYQIWDFGENHYSVKDGKEYYSHDNFVERNMAEDGYKKMVNALKKYINNLNYEREDQVKINM